MEDVHHSQRWNRLCEHLFGADTPVKTLPEMITHLEQLLMAHPSPEGVQAENELLRLQLQEAQARIEAAESYLDTLEGDGPQIAHDEAMLLLEAENQQLRDAIASAGQVPTDAPAQHELNDCAIALLRQLDQSTFDWALEVCGQDNLEPWQLVTGHVALAQERGELSSPALDPGWATQGRTVKNFYTCGGCGKTEPGRVGQLFCSNACAALAAKREAAKQAVSDEEMDRRLEAQRQPGTRTPIRRQGALI